MAEGPAPQDSSQAVRADGPDICVLLNAGSGAHDDATSELRGLLDRHPGRFDLRVLRSGTDIARETDRAVAQGFATIVAAGGDGTISGVAPRLVDTPCRLGVIPMGTFNYFARSLELPLDPEPAIEALIGGVERRIPVSQVNGHGFLNNASIGAYAAILQRREKVYRRWGRSRLAAYWSVLTTLLRFRSTLDLAITVDGATRRLRTPLVFVANNAHQVERFELSGAECIEAGKFAAFVAPDCTRLELVGAAIRLAMGAMQPSRDFELLCGAEIVIETRRARRLVAMDGERTRMTGPFRFTRRSDALRVVVPATGAGET